jgi:glycine/D-amino acid oxidase-like deaminating enzyme
MNLSYWEQQSWFSKVDFCVIGSGIVGLNCALALRQHYPKAKILVLERGQLPQGASTKNAGFACFGSVSELLADLEHHTEDEVFNLVNQRYKGLQLLRDTLGDKAIDYQQYGGYEVFLNRDQKRFEACDQQMKRLNELLHPIFKTDVFHLKPNNFNFKSCLPQLIQHQLEGQIDTGKMMRQLLQNVQSKGILVLNSAEVLSVSAEASSVKIQLHNLEFTAQHTFVATNAFAKDLLDVKVTPARNQVLITKPIKNLQLKGCFHLDEGYVYFRNIHNRILLGGARNLSPEVETTPHFGLTNQLQTALETLLHEVILPDHDVEIDQRWSGILGVGQQKKPMVKSVSNNLHCAVRLGGMGVAIGSIVGKALAERIS